MYTALRSFKAYHRYHLEQQLRQVLPALAIEQALQTVDEATDATLLPYQDIAEPYLLLVTSGWTGGPQQLRKLLELSSQLVMTFAAFVEWLLAKREDGAQLQVDTDKLLFNSALAFSGK